MHIIAPLAIVLFLLRASRGITDTMKKYEGAGVSGAYRPRVLTDYQRGLL